MRTLLGVIPLMLMAMLVLFEVIFPLIREIQNAQPQAVTSTDCGSWHNVSEPTMGLGIVGGFENIAAISNDDVWLVGNDSSGERPMFVHWNGDKFSLVPAPQIRAEFASVRGVAAVSTDDVWAVGYYVDKVDKVTGGNSQPLIAHWDGTKWSTVPSPNMPEPLVYDTQDFNSLIRITALSKNNVWAVGLYKQSSIRTLAEHWDGTKWSTIPSPDAVSSNNGLKLKDGLTGIATVTSTGTGVVGDYEFLNDTSPPYATVQFPLHWDGYQWSTADAISITAWDGKRWSDIPSPIPLPYYNDKLEVVAITANDAWAIRYEEGSFPRQTLLLHWDGATWSEVPGPAVSDGQDLRAIAAAPNGDIWVAGDSFAESAITNSVSGRTLVSHFVRCSNATK